jgi:NAD(P)-dependent dehydrogenase (short-subunit alcohol dehydrogenase family)
MDRLKGKRALITGGTTGIGLETAHRFAEKGARVIATGTNPKTLDAARIDLGDSVTILASDASSVPEQKKLAQAVQQQFGQLDVLFINAGVADLGPVEQWDEARFDRSFSLNVKAPFFLIQALLPVFSSNASIVMNGSVNAHIGMPNTTVYAATKASLLSYVRTHAHRRTGRTRHSCERRQSRPDHDPALQQAGSHRSRPEKCRFIYTGPGPCEALRHTARSRRRSRLFCFR